MASSKGTGSDRRHPTGKNTSARRPSVSVGKTSSSTGRPSRPAPSSTAGSRRSPNAARKRTSPNPPAVKRNTRQSKMPSSRITRTAHSTTASDVGRSEFVSGMWTKDASSKGKVPSGSSSRKTSSGFTAITSAVGGFFATLFDTLMTFFARNRGPRIVLIVALVALIAFGVDTGVNHGKIYPGVKMGEIDLGGKTLEEADELLSAEYSSRVLSNTALFFADENALNNAKTTDTDETLEEQISFEESLANRRQWTTPSSQVQAVFDSSQLAEDALEVGRENGGLITRIQCALMGVVLTPYCTYNQDLISHLSTSISSSVGELRVDYGVEMKDSVATVVDGHSGREVTPAWLEKKLNEAYFSTDAVSSSIVEIEDMPLRITYEAARACADMINNSLSQGARFVFESASWTLSAENIASWVGVSLVEENGAYHLQPEFKEDSAKTSLLANAQTNINRDNIEVSFAKNADGTISVSSNAQGTVPQVSQTVSDMNETFFTEQRRTSAPEIVISSGEIPATMTFSEACDFGLVGEISSFTTQYASGAEARNHNIHLAADYLNNSIAKANGGRWSFNEVAGEATAERGYQGAGAIVSGEYSDAIGGGICQVATTVFNTIYDAGYPVKQRHNHTLYIASYPEGRDAAIAYPDMDLIWENDTTSDVLLVMSYTSTSITAKLYGVDPNYVVSTDYGEWEEGKKFTTKYRDDPAVKTGVETVETAGSDGRKITIVRTVKDSSGSLRHEDAFTSVYEPKTEVIVRGTG